MILLNDYDDFLDIMAVTLDFVYGYQDMGRDLRPFSDPHDNSKSKVGRRDRWPCLPSGQPWQQSRCGASEAYSSSA
ncbi:hypothetical protein ACLB2K_064726 [Fragaria x ananassa]